MSYKINKKCVACGACEPECTAGAIVEGAKIYTIDPQKCTDCSLCARICPMEAIMPPK